MKRFYKEVKVEPAAGGFEIRLDGRPVRTPARAALALPSQRLSEAVAEEWRVQGDKVEPRSMPLTGLANAAIDRVGPERDAFAAGLAGYGESDLLCYRADGPPGLAARQQAAWDPLLAWARRRFDVDFETVTGIVHRPQPPAAVERLRRAVAARSPFELAGLAPLVTISGSLVIALALAERSIDAQTAWDAATIDEAWQAEHWGVDEEAEAVRTARRAEFDSALRFLSLL
jgi:chaperone required for assembly of F1-ATPase